MSKHRNNLKLYREQAKMTLQYLAIASGTSKSSIFEIESGNTVPLLYKAYAIAEALNVGVKEVFPDPNKYEIVTVVRKQITL